VDTVVGSRLRRHAPLALVLVVGAALRLYPVHLPYVGVDTQEVYPRAAVLAVAEGHWRSRWIAHGPGFFDALRAMYSVWYGVGRVAGLHQDRLDLLATFVARPLPFIVGGRVLVVACALLALVLIARLGRDLGAPAGGLAGAALLAVTFSHVRESHQVWPDVPAGTLTLAAIAASVVALRDRRIRWVVAAGALGGFAIATKLSTFPVALPVALGAFCSQGRLTARAARALAAGLAAVGAYVIASPYTLLAFQTARQFMTDQWHLTVGPSHGALPLGRLVVLGIGLPLTLLGGAGLVMAARRRPLSAWLVVAAFPIAYAVVLLASTRLFVRYLVLLIPFVALFAGYAVTELARAIVPRHAGPAAALVVLVLAARPVMLAVEYDRFLAREDTRSLAGAWLAEHAAADAWVTIPEPTGYVNPILPPNDLELRRRYPGEAVQLRRRLASAFRGWTVAYLASFEQIARLQPRQHFVVTSAHPALFGHLSTPFRVVAAIQQAGGRPVARFVGAPDPLAPEVCYDPIDADYVPLRGWNALVRPGPNLTIWQLPGRD